ncbi:MAG: M6 family metalloprotease domain-containing protein [Candidatus Eisenbacteria bacterium]
MKPSLVVLAAVLVFAFCSNVFAVFPSRPALAPDGKPLATKTFVEVPRMLAGERYMPRPTEKIVVILVEFPADTYDDPGTAIIDTCAAVTFKAGHDSTFYRKKIFKEAAGSYSMDNYWDECSLGMMDIDGIVIGPYTMPHSMKYYGWHNGDIVDDGWNDDTGVVDSVVCGGGGVTGTCRLIQDAVNAADPDIDFCLYDADADTSVDHVMVLHAGIGEEGGSNPHTIWSWYYWGLFYGPYDAGSANCVDSTGTMVTSGFIVPEYYNDSNTVPLGTWCHEFSHSIGNPDLYDGDPGWANVPDTDDYPVMDWCLMDHGSWCGPTGWAERPSHLMGFNKAGCGWAGIKVVTPTKDTTTFTIYDLETSIQPPQGNTAQILRLQDPTVPDEYWLIENRHPQEANTYFDKLDSDWSDWTGSGGPDSLDCGLIISHSIIKHTNMVKNSGTCSYDYVFLPPNCVCTPWPYEVWVEDPGYDDRKNADWNEWWYPWEVKAGAAYADTTEDPHYLWDQTQHANANCTFTASSIDYSTVVTKIYVEATSKCSGQMTAKIYVPGWVGVIPVIPEPHFCQEWSSFHHDVISGGWTFTGGLPYIDAPYADRLQLAWSATGATTVRSSPVVTNTQMTIPPGDVVRGLAIVSSSDGMVYCYSAEDGRPVWATPIGVPLRSTPLAVDTVYGRGGVSMVLDRVYVNATNNRVYYLNLRTGAIEGFWPEPGNRTLEAPPRIAMVENPNIAGDFTPLVFVGSGGGTMYALNATSPSVRWQYLTGSVINCPVVMGRVPKPTQPQSRVDAIFYGDNAGTMRCVMAYDGTPKWSRTMGSMIVASPSVCDSVTQDGISSQADETVVVATNSGRVYALDAASGNQLWQYETGSTDPINSSPSVAVDRAHNWGMVWFESTNGTVYCLDLGKPKGTSRLIWSYATGGGTASSPGVVLPYGMLPLGFDGMGEPIFPPECATGDPEHDGVVYVGCGGTGGGRVLALDAADGSPVWEYSMPQAVSASPAPTLGRMYVSADRLYAFEPNQSAGVGDKGGTALSLDLRVGPNPVSAASIIEYSVPVESRVSLKVYDVRGRLVKSVFDGTRVAGAYRTEWAGTDDDGASVAPGIYFARLDVGTERIVKKMVLVK